MEAGDWSRLENGWDRLRWARLRWQVKSGGATTGKAAADSLGMIDDTYTAYERAPGSSKHTPLDAQRAIQFARKFQCNWVWLYTGHETPFGRTEAQDRAIAALAPLAEEDQLDLAKTIEVLAERKAG